MHAYALPSLPALAPQGPSRSPHRCRKDSTTKRVRFAPMSRQEAGRLVARAERIERDTRARNRQDGAIGRNGLAVLRALLGFLNWKTGQLDPSHAAIARRANISERSVRRGLAKLKGAGIVHWVRRCAEVMRDGRFTLEQQSNAYAVLPTTQWASAAAEVAPPRPEPGTWGDHPPLPDAITAALQDKEAGCSRAAFLAILETDPGDGLASALARLGRRVSGLSGGGNG